MRKTLRCALAALAVTWTVGASAQEQPADGGKPEAGVSRDDFFACDGFGPMTRLGDGMTEEASGFFVTGGGDRVRSFLPSGDPIGACTRVVDLSATEFPNQWMRRVSLLQSRALHRLNERDFDGALADLDLADQAALEPADPFYRRSLNINTNLIRAFVLIENGHRDAGETLAMETWARRPYSREVTIMALMVVGQDGEAQNIETLINGLSRLDPRYSDFPFFYHFNSGRFEQALAYHSGVVVVPPIQTEVPSARVQIMEDDMLRARNEVFWLEMNGRRAYALAALGRLDEARAALAEADVHLANATPPPEPPDRDVSRQEQYERSARLASNRFIETNAPPLRDAWAAIVAARIAAAEGRLEEARSALPGLQARQAGYAMVELLEATGADDQTVLAMRRQVVVENLEFPLRTVPRFLGMLLDGETRTRAASQMDALSAVFALGTHGRGGCSERRPHDGTRRVCYAGVEATLAVTEERALLRAAARAADEGGRFRIDRRNDIRHSVINTSYGIAMSESQMGFETVLFIRSIPAGEECPRCIVISEVEAALSDVYAQALQTSRARR